MGLEMDFSQLLDAVKGNIAKQIALSPEVVAAGKSAAKEQASLTIGESIIKYWPVALGVVGVAAYGLFNSMKRR